MKMVMAVVPKEEASEVVNELVAAGHTATFMESTGGALRETSETLFIAVQKEDLERVLDIIDRYCSSSIRLSRIEPAGGEQAAELATAQVGGAVVFVWDLERFYRRQV